MKCKEKYWNLFMFKVFLLILFLSFITGYPLAYLTYTVGAEYQPISFNILFVGVYVFIMTILFIMMGYYAQIKLIIKKDRIIIKSIFRTQNIELKSIKEVHLIKYKSKKDGMAKIRGVSFIMDNGSEIYAGTTNNLNMVECIIKKMREESIPILVIVHDKFSNEKVKV